MHLKQLGSRALHISHIHGHVSAHYTTPESVAELEKSIEEALKIASDTLVPQMIDQDGEMFIVCHPAGTISLCLRWQEFEILKEVPSIADMMESAREATHTRPHEHIVKKDRKKE